jgi:glycosyltransferase involved in cell wall biosynthesis
MVAPMDAPVRVMLNDRCLRNPQTGVGVYVTQLLAALPQAAPDVQILPFYSTYLKSPALAGPMASQPAVPPSPPRSRRVPWTVRRLAQDVYNAAFEATGSLRGYRVYHEPNHIPMPWHGPILTTVHDLSVLRHPEWHPADRAAWYEQDFDAGLARTHHFIAVSEFTRREMVEMLGIKPERITVIHEAARSIFRPRPAEETRAWLTAHRLPADYFLYVGTIEPRKNLPGLLEAYASLSPQLRSQSALLIAGMHGWARETVDALGRRLGIGDRVIPLGYVSDDDLAMLYAAARALVWPTFYEGFGLPPLECMASGTPVITSNCSSLPEVVGEAGLLIDPHDPAAIADAMRRIAEDPDLADTLRRQGLERSRQFSWSQCAAEHAQLYRRLALEA